MRSLKKYTNFLTGILAVAIFLPTLFSVCFRHHAVDGHDQVRIETNETVVQIQGSCCSGEQKNENVIFHRKSLAKGSNEKINQIAIIPSFADSYKLAKFFDPPVPHYLNFYDNQQSLTVLRC